MEDNESPVQAEENAIRYVFQTTWDRLKLVLGFAFRMIPR